MARFATLTALLALFVALGGPAEARRLISGKQIRDRSVTLRDLSRKTVRQLKFTPRGTVRERQLANGAVTSGKLADLAVTTGKLAPGAVGEGQLADGAAGPRAIRAGAVTAAQVADGSLDARDLARYHGRFRVSLPAVPAGECWSGEPVGLAAEEAGADISGDLVLVTPDDAWPERELAFTVRNSSNRSRFVLAGCNATGRASEARDVGFRYAVVELP
jgi:hypothetical protein